MSSNDVNGPYRPAGGRGADDNSGGARGAVTGGSATGGGRHSAGRNGNGSRGYTRGNVSGNGNGQGAGGKYPDPEGWGEDGFWRDSSMDSDYETGLNRAVRTNGNGPRGDGGYSYWADGKGWENSPGNGARQDKGAAPAKGFGRRNRNGGGGNHTRVDSFATRTDGYATRMDGYPTRSDQGSGAGFGPGGEPTAFYGGTAAPGLGAGGNGNGGGPAGYRDGGQDPGRGPWRPGRGTRGPGGPRRVKVKGSWWRHWGWKKVLGLFGAFLAMIVLLLVGTYYYLYNSTQIPTQPVADIAWQNSTVYYSDGTTPIGTFGEIHRQVLQYDQIPQKVDDAVMAAEDRHFMTEGGISPTGILRAAYEDLFGNGGSLQGGSTITQQFVRNYYQDIGTEQTTSRKIKEIFVAMKLAKTKSKQWILQNYLNMIYLGTGAYGVGAAAETYFHLPIGKVSIAQAAVIAAIIQEPNNYPQPEFRSELVARWHYVLNGMVTMGDLTQQQADTMAFPKMYDSPEQSYGSDPWDPYVMNVVENELEGVDHLTVGKLDTGGYKIVTTISRSKETALYSAVNQNLKLMRAQGTPLPWYALVGAELQNPATGAIVAMYPGRGQNMTAKNCTKYDCDLNTAVYAREQVGSSFKPYVLAASVQAGMNVQTSVLNASPQLWVPPDSMPLTLSAYTAAKAVPEAFHVHNDAFETIGGTKAGGATTVTNALALSSNTAYTDLAHRVGTGNIIKMAANFGVNIDSYKYGGSGLTDMLHQVGMALGTASLTVNEQATMLSTIDDNGTFHSAHIVASYQASGGPVVPGFVKQYQALPAGLDSQVQYAMSQTTVYGTGTAAAMTDGRPIIGKTGTTDNAESAFFIGAIPQYSLVVGIFTQQQNGISSETLNGIGGFGGIWPAAIWHTFAEMEFSKLPIENFQSPIFSGAKWVQVAPQPKKKKKPTKTVCTKFRFRCPPPGGGGHGHHGGPSPTASPNPTNTFPTGGPSPTATSGSPTPTGTGSTSGTPTPTGTATGPGGGQGHPAPTASTVQAGIALGGILTVLPGSLLWTRASRRRRRRRGGAAR